MKKSRLGLHLNNGIGMIHRVQTNASMVFYFQPFPYLVTCEDISVALTDIRKRFLDEDIEQTVCITDAKDRVSFRTLIIDQCRELKFGETRLIGLDSALCQAALFEVPSIVHDQTFAVISNYPFYAGCFFWKVQEGRIRYRGACYSDLKPEARDATETDLETLKEHVYEKQDLLDHHMVFVDDQISESLFEKAFSVQEKCKMTRFRGDKITLAKMALLTARINAQDYFDEKQNLKAVCQVVDQDFDLMWKKTAKVMDFHRPLEVPFQKTLHVTEKGVLEISDGNPLDSRNQIGYNLCPGSYTIRINQDGILEVINTKGEIIKPSKNASCVIT